MQAIRLPARVRAEMLAHAREDAPRECCGLLVGTGTDHRRVRPQREPRSGSEPLSHRSRSPLRGQPAAARQRPRRDRRLPLASALGGDSLAQRTFSRRTIRTSSGSSCRWRCPKQRQWRRTGSGRSGFVRCRRCETARRHRRRGHVNHRVHSGRIPALQEARGSRDRTGAGRQARGDGVRPEQLDHRDLLARVGQPQVALHRFPHRRRRETVAATATRSSTARQVGRAELLAKWEDGWSALFGALAGLSDDALSREVTIRGAEAFGDRGLAPVARAHQLPRGADRATSHEEAAGSAWTSLSIPKGQSAAFNANPSGQKPPEQIAALERRQRH